MIYSPIVDQYGRSIPKPRIRARYDAAQTTDDNRNHWAMADGLSAVSSNSQGVRKTLRDRSRYEATNNCYCRGIIDTRAAYYCGTGPTLQLTRADGRADSAGIEVERKWGRWCKVRHIPRKVLTACKAIDTDGESFGMMGNGKPTMLTPVWLDVRLYEADQFEHSNATGMSWKDDDAGVRIDSSGNPTRYAMLREHPGDANLISDLSSRWVSADRVLHCFRQDRPGQLRGVPATTPALPLFALLRRFTLATVTAAETAADFAAVLSGQLPADPDLQQQANAWERVELERGAMVTVPDGQVLSQLKAEHPNATYDEFVRAILREISRAFPLPAVLSLGDSSNYNYASGRLDLQSLARQAEVDRRTMLEDCFLNPLLQEWFDEALAIPDFLPEFEPADWDVSWRWPMPEHVDRQKEAAGQAQELANGTTTLKREYASRGLDWAEELEQRAVEEARKVELGLSNATAESASAD